MNKPEKTLMEKPIEFTVGGETFQVEGWTYEQQEKVIGLIMSQPEKLTDFREQLVAVKSSAKSKFDFIPLIMKVLGTVINDVFAITLNKPREWVDKHITLGRRITLAKIIWDVNDLSEISKNF